MKTKKAVAVGIVKAIVADLDDRRGLGHEWRAIDAEIKKEILETWERIVRVALAER